MNDHNFFLTCQFLLLLLVIPGTLADNLGSPDGLGGVGYYLASHSNDTIPSMMEAGREYDASITFTNRGLSSWEWGTVEKFGMLYQGLQSSVEVRPIFSPIPSGIKVPSGQSITFPIHLTPPQKAGNYTLGFSMATSKHEEYVPFSDGFTKDIQVIPQDGISSDKFGSIRVESVPSGASVSLNGQSSGQTPLTIPDLNPAKYSLDIVYDKTLQTVSVPVETASVSRVSVDFVSGKKVEVQTERLGRYTVLGWILDHLLLIGISILIIFVGFQFLMLNTERFPEEHILRRYARAFILVPVNFDGEVKGSRKGAKGARNAGVTEVVAGEGVSGKQEQMGSSSVASKGRKKGKESEGRRTGDAGSRKVTKTEEDKEFSHPDDVEQEQQMREDPWGFPDQLKDRYEPLGIAGDDPYARVFKVRALENNAIRALKISHVKDATSEILRKEASVWGVLRHPNIVRLFRAEYSEDLTFFENEYLDGVRYKGNNLTSLSALPKPIKEKYAVAVIRDIAQGLKYAHNYGIRHYHLQTGDVLLTPHMQGKISGFARGKNEIGFSIPDSDISEAPSAYISPEQRYPDQYGNTGKRTDIYQLGVIFYELLTGYLPYSKEAYQKAFPGGEYDPQKHELISPSRIRPAAARYDPILNRMLSMEKKSRYSSIEEFLSDLDSLTG